ncbi:hypothetical protein LCGC14_2808810 [marine sediment metagenome]|uniref:Uncharacterized protein n=1 Tax=marine sediment metagenome TaxID=412755 RepID=A0A0F9AU06_9ZZZZ
MQQQTGMFPQNGDWSWRCPKCVLECAKPGPDRETVRDDYKAHRAKCAGINPVPAPAPNPKPPAESAEAPVVEQQQQPLPAAKEEVMPKVAKKKVAKKKATKKNPAKRTASKMSLTGTTGFKLKGPDTAVRKNKDGTVWGYPMVRGAAEAVVDFANREGK